MEQSKTRRDVESSKLEIASDSLSEGASIGSILRRIGTQAEEFQSISSDELGLESQDDGLRSVWAID